VTLRQRKLEINAGHLNIDLQRAVPLGLTLNELITNALKHAYPDGEAGSVRVDLHQESEFIVASVADDGIGLPDPLPSNSLGLKLVGVLAEQLGGDVRFEAPPGTRITLRFPA
jgi:two-component sensor histidine kinase